MPYGPHTAADRARMLDALGVASVDELFADIPAGLRAHGLALPDGQPELELAADLEALAGRNRTNLASFLGAGRLPPLPAAGGRPDPAPRRVVHGLHAVPARGQPGHAPEHLRVPVAAGRADRPRCRLGLALRRRRGHGRGRPDDLPGDRPPPDPGQPGGPPALPRDAGDVPLGGRPRAGRDPDRRRPARPPARPTWPRSSGCWPRPIGRSPA